jgi:hypothetical protein
MSNTSEPWERQPDESPKAFEAFTIYRNLGSSRSMAKVAEQLGKSNQLMSRWSRLHGWVRRAEAWDNEQDRLARQEQAIAIKKMRKRHANLAEAMLIKAAKALQRIPDDEVKASDIPRMVETAARLERISRGDVGDVVESRDGGESIPSVQFYIPSNGRDHEETSDE